MYLRMLPSKSKMSSTPSKEVDQAVRRFERFIKLQWNPHQEEVEQLKDAVKQLQITVGNLVKNEKNLQRMQATVNYLKFEDMKEDFTVEPEHSTAVWNLRKVQIQCIVLKLNKDSTKALISFYNLKQKPSQRIVNYTELTFI